MRVPDGKKNEHIVLLELVGEPTSTYERVKAARSDPKNIWYGYSTHTDKQKTDQIATTFNTRTMQYADNSVYLGSKGYYIKKDSKRFYLDDFE